MLNRLKQYRMQAFAIYLLLCLLYCTVRVAVPVESGRSEGLEDLGRRQIVERTPYLEDGETLSFELPVESEPLTSIGFYLNTDELLLDGTLEMEAKDRETGESIGKTSILLDDIVTDQFVVLSTDPFHDGTVVVELTTRNSEQGPRFWLNSTVETNTATWLDGEKLPYTLVYNAGFQVMVREVKSAVLTTLMAILFGVVIYISLEGPGKEKEKKKWRPAERAELFYRKNKTILGGLFVVFLIAFIFYYLYDSQIRIVMNTTQSVEVLTGLEETILFSEVSGELVQQYECEEDTLTGLGVKLYVPEGESAAGTLKGSVTDLTTGELLCESEFQAASAIDQEYFNLIFSHAVEASKGHRFEICMTPSKELQSTGAGLYITAENAYPDSTLLMNGETQSFDLVTLLHEYFNIFLKKYFFFMLVAVELFAMLLYWMLFIKKCRLENTVFVALICIGAIYGFLLLPYMAPDEENHIDMSYRYSNQLLGIEQVGDTAVLERMDDAKLKLSQNAELSNYYTVYHHLFELVDDNTLVSANAKPNTYAPMIVYLPCVVGMTLGRLLHFGAVPMLIFARWCSMLFFALCVWWCMKKLPFGKMALAVIALFPMTIQQCNSFSYDAVITGCLLLFSTYVICMTYDEGPIRVRDVVIISVLSALLVYGKSGVYLPFCLMACLIPTAKFHSLQKKILCVGSFVGIGLLSFVNKNAGTVNMVMTTTAETSAVGNSVGNAADMGYTVGYFLQNPAKLFTILETTVTDKLQFYIESIVGQKMGYVEVEISAVLVIAFTVLFIFSMLKVRGEKQYVTAGQKWWICLVCLLSVGMILMGMLLSWTPFGYVSIEGVQGRYFTPLLLMFSLVGRNRLVMFMENKDRAILCTGLILELLAVMYLIKALIIIS